MIESFTSRSLSLNEFELREYEWYCWSSPSNIALAKYWGKKDNQIPQNPSVSFTLNSCRTNMMVISSPKLSAEASRSFYFNGRKSDSFGSKALSLIDKLSTDVPILKNFDLQIITENTFPHSSGIASSASAMSSLSLCICDLLSSIKSIDFLEKYDFNTISSMYSRLGSGSACRSVFGGVALWGKLDNIAESSDEYAVKVSDVAPVFNTFRDSVLIISSEEKSVSSTAGHGQMNSHPFRHIRYANAKNNCVELIDLMRKGDVWKWGEIVEKEALELHGLMMNGPESFILMKPNTLKVIEKVRSFRNNFNIPLFFTLDAGPNVHLLYPDEFKVQVVKFIQNELIYLLEDDVWFDDFVGDGPIKLTGNSKC